MTIDRGNHCSDYLRQKIDLNNFYNLRYSNKNGRINKISSFLSSHQLVTSIKKSKNLITQDNEIQYLIDNFESLRKEYDFDSYSWIMNAYFDKDNPKNSILNVAFPSAIAYY